MNVRKMNLFLKYAVRHDESQPNAFLGTDKGHWVQCKYLYVDESLITLINGPRQANLVLIAYASNEGSGEPAHPRSLARTSAARSYKQ